MRATRQVAQQVMQAGRAATPGAHFRLPRGVHRRPKLWAARPVHRVVPSLWSSSAVTHRMSAVFVGLSLSTRALQFASFECGPDSGLVTGDAADADRVAERVTNREIGPIRLLRRLLSDISASGDDLVECGVDVVGGEGQPPAARA
jgi:hypothetical protein